MRLLEFYTIGSANKLAELFESMDHDRLSFQTSQSRLAQQPMGIDEVVESIAPAIKSLSQQNFGGDNIKVRAESVDMVKGEEVKLSICELVKTSMIQRRHR